MPHSGRKEKMSLIDEIRHAQMRIAERLVIRNLERQGLAKSAPHTDWIANVQRDICELPDRASPEGQPNMCLVTMAELRQIIEKHLPINEPLTYGPGR
jgi:hypothetical protein